LPGSRHRDLVDEHQDVDRIPRLVTGAAQPAEAFDESDMRRTDPRWQPGNYEKNLDAVRRLGDLAAIHEIPARRRFRCPLHRDGSLPDWI
jgi:hypothetical protein